jgi:hypothetical protein
MHQSRLVSLRIERLPFRVAFLAINKLVGTGLGSRSCFLIFVRYVSSWLWNSSVIITE